MQSSTIFTTTNNQDAYFNFVNSLDSKVSRKLYANTFTYFMKFCQIDRYDPMLLIPVKQLESKIKIILFTCD